LATSDLGVLASILGLFVIFSWPY